MPLFLYRIVTSGHFAAILNGVDDADEYNQVRVVELKNSESKVKEQFALKYIRKIDTVRADFAYNVIRERKILQELEHPLIVNLRYAFQDEEFMYMVSDLMYLVCLRIDIDR